MSYAQAAFLEPLSCVVHSIELLAPAPGSVVAVIGNGGFGILHALLLQRRGIEVLLFGRRPQRVALARDLGLESFDTNAVADFAGSSASGPAAAAPTPSIECTGTAEMWEQAPSLVRRGGRVSFFAGLPAGTRVYVRRGADSLRRGAVDWRPFTLRRPTCARPTS